MSNNIVDPNSVGLIFSGASALGSGGGMPSEGLLKVICSESSIRKSTKGASLWLTLTVSEGPSNGYKVYTYVSLPTPEAAQKTTKFGTLAEFFEKIKMYS